MWYVREIIFYVMAKIIMKSYLSKDGRVLTPPKELQATLQEAYLL